MKKRKESTQKFRAEYSRYIFSEQKMKMQYLSTLTKKLSEVRVSSSTICEVGIQSNSFSCGSEKGKHGHLNLFIRLQFLTQATCSFNLLLKCCET